MELKIDLVHIEKILKKQGLIPENSTIRGIAKGVGIIQGVKFLVELEEKEE